MRITRITLANCRNYGEATIEPQAGLNVFLGRNAQGKSNLLEAIGLLGTGKSFRTSREAEIVREGYGLAAVSADAVVRSGNVTLGFTIARGERTTRKTLTINGRAVRYGHFLGKLRVVSFAPADLAVIVGAPGLRRAFLNLALAQEQPNYYTALAMYARTLRQKNALLRSGPPYDEELFAIYDRTMVERGARMTLARAQYVQTLGPHARAEHLRWSAGEELVLGYNSAIGYEIGDDEAMLRERFERALEAGRTRERARGAALVGPHRDDLTLALDGRSLAEYGSQGQHRTALLALKVAEYRAMAAATGEAPLLLLDDVLSELDPDRAARFLDGLGGFEQAFVTATHLEHALPGAAAFSIEGARIARVA